MQILGHSLTAAARQAETAAAADIDQSGKVEMCCLCPILRLQDEHCAVMMRQRGAAKEEDN